MRSWASSCPAPAPANCGIATVKNTIVLGLDAYFAVEVLVGLGGGVAALVP